MTKNNFLTFSNRIVSGVIILPLLAIIGSIFVPTANIWSHLIETNLSIYITDSLIVGTGAVIGSAIIGGASAILCSLYTFPGKKLFGWMMILPLAFPVYIAGYTYNDIFSYGGWGFILFQSLGIQIPFRSIGGAIFIFSLTLYPYVYLMVRATLSQQSGHLMQAAQLLGLSPTQTIFRFIIPTIWPALIASGMLVLMETLSDYATVKYFGVNTLSVGIFRTWFGLGSLATATQMASLLLCVTVGLIIIEKQARRRLRYYSSYPASSRKMRHLHGFPVLGTVLICVLPILLGFILPLTQLIGWVLLSSTNYPFSYYIELIENTLILGIGSAVFIVFISLLICYSDRTRNYAQVHWTNRIATSGYAIPGVIIAVGILFLGTALEKTSSFASSFFNDSLPPIFISGTLFALYFAYIIRFTTLGFNAIENSLTKIPLSLDQVSATLNVDGVRRLRLIHLPLIQPGILVAIILVFVEVVKEVPATLVLRPFDFNTLAIHSYEIAEAENLPAMGIPALFIVLASILPLFILWNRIRLFR